MQKNKYFIKNLYIILALTIRIFIIIQYKSYYHNKKFIKKYYTIFYLNY